MSIDNTFEFNNEEEAEIAQILALQMNDRALAEHRAKMPKGPSLEECEECGDPIPKQRQLAVQGVTMCIHCQERSERMKRLYGNVQS